MFARCLLLNSPLLLSGRDLTLEEVLAALCCIQREVAYRAHAGKRGKYCFLKCFDVMSIRCTGDSAQSAQWRAAFCTLGSHYCSAPNADRDSTIDRAMNANALITPIALTSELFQRFA